MASARARLGAARRGIKKGQRQTDMWGNIASTVTSAAMFAAGQAKKADTAWGEYEKGYEAVTGSGIDTSVKFGQKGWLTRTFGKPKGDLTIRNTKYQMENIQKAGQFLGGQVSSLLDPTARKTEVMRLAGGEGLEIPKTATPQTQTIIPPDEYLDYPEDRREPLDLYGSWKKNNENRKTYDEDFSWLS